MKKNMKKQLLVGFLALTMFFSSAAWIFLSAAPVNPQQQGNQTQVPENFVVEGRLTDDIATQFLQRGYSLMEWHYYEGCCADLMLFVEALPNDVSFTDPQSGSTVRQLIVQKISDSNSTWATVRSLRGEQQWNVSSANDLLPPLCEVLAKPPVECGLMQFGNQTR
jgi:hypothetical protein